MKSYSLILVAIILIVGIGCQQKPAMLTEGQKVAMEKEIKTQFDGLVRSHSLFDDTWLQYYSKTKFYGVIFLNKYWSLQALSDTARIVYWPQLISKRMELRDAKIHLLSPTSAVIINYATVYHFTKAKEERKFDGIETILWEKEPSGWKVIYNHQSF